MTAMLEEAVTHEMVVLKDLQVELGCQRPLNKKWVQELAVNWRTSVAGVIHVAVGEDGTYYICDGQHRKAAAIMSGVEVLPAVVHHGLSKPERAALFLQLNFKKKVSPRAEFRVGVTSGQSRFLDVQRALTAHGLQYGPTTAHQCSSVNSLLAVVDRYGYDILDRTLSVLEMAWGHSRETWTSPLIKGTARFLGVHGYHIGDQVLAQKMAEWGTASAWVGKARDKTAGRASGPQSRNGLEMSVYLVICDAWNRNRRGENRIS